MDENEFILKLNECYNLADKGRTQRAQVEFENCVKEFQKESLSYLDTADKKYHRSRLNYCQGLLDEGNIGLAKFEFEKWFDEFQKEELEYNKKKFSVNYKLIFKIMEKASHRIAVNNLLKSAEEFYKKGDKSGAHNNLYIGRLHAHKIQLNIKNEISEIKERYNDNGLIGKIEDCITEGLLYLT
ncbi:hypothetical protein COY26_01115 [Candidatus Woesearchaeota archaeon CG_4_10_14_0_2_um_filter_33_10]|nr:MAG: hypothetical protein COV14_04465 [Candidatus Woesearchaeota archaeon CG10_big_fil_rev_8_21_14_0_10_33_12]PIU72404.1 MAG: hypothetical protein COS79_03145 [Candidatus Woesearchaeota archaeon CG06_land_8_20_14_3_00_33_13]PIZ53701.1 MAG: hypothetical protein COY26_01115 [Candidatus Woesearchaeota archaeon CG_4_10_14_0_2_um_filter_33_10]